MRALTPLLLLPFFISAQQINIHSVADKRQYGGAKGYTLDGFWMGASRGKLLFQDNFSNHGTYQKDIKITDGYANRNDLLTIDTVKNIDIFFFGTFNVNDLVDSDPTRNLMFSTGEIEALYQWSKKGGKMIIAGSAPDGMYNPAILNYRWDYMIRLDVPSFVIPTELGRRTKIFDGPFGTLTAAGQGGSSQGYFREIPPTAVVLAENFNKQPTMIFDCATRDLIVADVDIYTTVGGLSSGPVIENGQDKLWGNSIAFMDDLSSVLGPPVITQNGNTLSTTSKFASYQWYYQTLLLGSDETFTPPKSGSYKVKVTDIFGCGTEVSQVFSYEKPSGPAKAIELDVVITPNLVTDDKLNIAYILPDANEYPTDFIITDAIGRLVFSSATQNVQRNANKLQADISTWANAVYNVDIKVGDRSFVRRFVKM